MLPRSEALLWSGRFDHTKSVDSVDWKFSSGTRPGKETGCELENGPFSSWIYPAIKWWIFPVRYLNVRLPGRVC